MRVLLTLKQREYCLGTFQPAKAERARGLVSSILGYEEPPPLNTSVGKESPTFIGMLKTTKFPLGKAIRSNLVFSIVGGILLALAFPILLPMMGHSFQTVSQIREGSSLALLESSGIPLAIGGYSIDEGQQLTLVSALGVIDSMHLQKDGECSHFYLPLHYFAMLFFLASGFFIAAYGLMTKKANLVARGLSYFTSCFILFGAFWLLGMMGFALNFLLKN